MSEVSVEVATEVTDELVSMFATLVPQLSSSSSPPDAGQLAEIIDAPSTSVLLARDGEGRLLGTLTLAVFRIPTAARAWIEDVVVDSSARGKGVATALVSEAVRLAERKGARTVELTSRPSREAANRLYRSLGFEPRETNVYRYEAATPPPPPLTESTPGR